MFLTFHLQYKFWIKSLKFPFSLSLPAFWFPVRKKEYHCLLWLYNTVDIDKNQTVYSAKFKRNKCKLARFFIVKPNLISDAVFTILISQELIPNMKPSRTHEKGSERYHRYINQPKKGCYYQPINPTESKSSFRVFFTSYCTF